MFGLDWGADPQRAMMRFEGIAPVVRTADDLEWLLFDIAARLMLEKAFLPTAMVSAADRDMDRVTLSFVAGALVTVRISFGYGFYTIGQDPDTLSDLAMAAFARAEWADLLTEMACHHGAPAHSMEAPARAGAWHLVGSALFVRSDGAPLGLRFGHDATGLVGDLKCIAPSASETGI
ncbi:MAG: hypothetical protein AAF557_17420 [Pseudomonadota bacterium]